MPFTPEARAILDKYGVRPPDAGVTSPLQNKISSLSPPKPTSTTTPTPSPVTPASVPSPATISQLKDVYKQRITLQKAAQNAGVSIPQQKKERSWFETLGNIIGAPSHAIGGILSGKGIIEGIKEKISPSQALGLARQHANLMEAIKDPRAWASFAVDVALDPLTYVGFGVGKGVRLAEEGVDVVLNKAGQAELKRLAEELGAEAARKELAKRVATGEGLNLIDKGGLKFLGKSILPQSAVTLPAKKAAEMVTKVPVLGPAAKKVAQAVGEKFTPELQRIGKIEPLRDFPGAAKEHLAGTRYEIAQALQEISDMVKKAYLEAGKGAGELVAHAIERGATTGNPLLDDFAKMLSKGYAQMAADERARNLLKEVIPNYMRHLLTKEGRKFLEERGESLIQFMASPQFPLRVRTPFAKSRKIVGVIEDINKAMKEQFGIEKFFEPDAFKAYAFRKAESIRAIRNYDFFKRIAEHPTWSIPAKLSKKAAKAKGDLEGLIHRISEKEAFVNGIRYVETKIPELEGRLVAEPIANWLNRASFVLGEEREIDKFLRLYDKLLNFWKGTVTGIWPSFHIRNFIGGVFNNYIAGVTDPRWYKVGDEIARGLDKTFTSRIGEKISYSKIREEVGRRGVTGQTGMGDVMTTLEEMIKAGARFKGHPSTWPRQAMTAVEDRLRLPLYVYRRYLGDSPEQAAKAVFEAHFDYAPEALSAFERQVMRRLIPFYRWRRGNIPFQLINLVKQPGKYEGLRHFQKTFGVSPDQEEWDRIPNWLKDSVPLFKALGNEKTAVYLYGMGLPVEDLQFTLDTFGHDTTREILSSFSPMLRAGVELATGKDLWTGKDLTNKAPNWVKYLPKPTKDWLEYESRREFDPKTGRVEDVETADPRKLYFLRSLISRGYFTFDRLLEDSHDVPLYLKALYLLTNIKARRVDYEAELLRKEREANQEMANRLLQGEHIREFRQFYQPERLQLSPESEAILRKYGIIPPQ